MSTKDKLIERFKKQPKDFTWEELVRLFGIFGYPVNNKGKTTGSRTLFETEEESYIVHKPHPTKHYKGIFNETGIGLFDRKKVNQ